MMVHLVSPDERRILVNAGDRMPLGVLYLSSALTANGINNRVFDLNHTNTLDLIDAVKTEKPDMIGLSVISSPTFPQMRRLAQELKPHTGRIIAGGHHMSVLPNSLDDYVDGVAVRNGEKAILRFASGETGIIDEEIDLNEYPIPDRTKLSGNVYDMHLLGLRIAGITTTRGCPFSCIEENQRVWFSRKPNNKIKTIKIGDILMSVNEETKKIEETKVAEIRTQEKELFEIELDSGNKITATEDHKFLTKRGWIQLKDLNEEDEILTADFKEKISFNKKILNPMKDKNIIQKMIDTTRKKGWYLFHSERMKTSHRKGKINYNSDKQKNVRRETKNNGEKNGNWNPNRKDRNLSILKKLIKKGFITQCSACNFHKNLLVHHKDKNRNNDSYSNLKIICKSCHEKIHNKIQNIKKIKK